MSNYEAMYACLFNVLSDVAEAIEKHNYGQAREMIMAAQRETEEIYISSED